MEDEAGAGFMDILVDVIYATRIDQTRSAFDAVNTIPFSKQKLS
jgi:hypothetical protein